MTDVLAVWVHDPQWTTDPEVVAGKRCRFGAGPHHPACGKPAVAALRRPRWGTHGTFWGYCEDHLYGRKLVGSRVLERRAVTHD